MIFRAQRVPAPKDEFSTGFCFRPACPGWHRGVFHYLDQFDKFNHVPSLEVLLWLTFSAFRDAHGFDLPLVTDRRTLHLPVHHSLGCRTWRKRAAWRKQKTSGYSKFR
jgi:hypothetical protein